MATGKGKLFPGRKAAWVALLLLVLIGLAIVMIPVWIVQPFKPQTESGLKLSYVLRSWSPLVTVLAAVAALGLVIWLFPGARRWWRKAALVLGLCGQGYERIAVRTSVKAGTIAQRLLVRLEDLSSEYYDLPAGHSLAESIPGTL